MPVCPREHFHKLIPPSFILSVDKGNYFFLTRKVLYWIYILFQILKQKSRQLLTVFIRCMTSFTNLFHQLITNCFTAVGVFYVEDKVPPQPHPWEPYLPQPPISGTSSESLQRGQGSSSLLDELMFFIHMFSQENLAVYLICTSILISGIIATFCNIAHPTKLLFQIFSVKNIYFTETNIYKY